MIVPFSVPVCDLFHLMVRLQVQLDVLTIARCYADWDSVEEEPIILVCSRRIAYPFVIMAFEVAI
jgi:hypothetical protein